MSDERATLEAARAGDSRAFERLVAPHRRELRAHCYRLSGSLHDADDLLQDTLLKAWRGIEGFEGRSSLRTWLYRVATSACLDALEKRPRRLLPADLGPASAADAEPQPPLTDPTWIEPWPGENEAVATAESPEVLYGRRQSVALAFVVALQLLPPAQRAVLLLRDVLGWSAAECAGLLALSVAAVNSALQRARATIAERAPALADARPGVADEDAARLLARYAAAWESSDVQALAALLRDDATLAMPPLPQWLRGAEAIAAALAAMVLTPGSRGQYRMRPTRVNGAPAFATYRREGEGWQALSLQWLELADGRIAAIVAFLDASLFGPFGLPQRLPPD